MPKRPVGYHKAYQRMTNGSPRERGKTETERIFGKIVAKKSPKLMKYLNLHIQEAQKPQARHIIIGLLKNKGILETEERRDSLCTMGHQ